MKTIITINSTRAQADIDYTLSCAQITETQDRLHRAQSKITGILAAGVFAVAVLACFVMPARAETSARLKPQDIVSVAGLGAYVTFCGPNEDERISIDGLALEYFSDAMAKTGRSMDDLNVALGAVSGALYHGLSTSYPRKVRFCQDMNVLLTDYLGNGV